MSRSYLVLISLLTVIALALGGFAFHRSLSQPPKPAPIPKQTPPPQQNEPTSNQPLVREAKSNQVDVDPSKNTLPLTITSPQNNATVSAARLIVTGSTTPNADVSVNEKDLIANPTGQFVTTITLDEGENLILITATNATGAAEQEVSVTYKPPGSN